MATQNYRPMTDEVPAPDEVPALTAIEEHEADVLLWNYRRARTEAVECLGKALESAPPECLLGLSKALAQMDDVGVLFRRRNPHLTPTPLEVVIGHLAIEAMEEAGVTVDGALRRRAIERAKGNGISPWDTA